MLVSAASTATDFSIAEFYFTLSPFACLAAGLLRREDGPREEGQSCVRHGRRSGARCAVAGALPALLSCSRELLRLLAS